MQIQNNPKVQDQREIVRKQAQRGPYKEKTAREKRKEIKVETRVEAIENVKKNN